MRTGILAEKEINIELSKLQEQKTKLEGLLKELEDIRQDAIKQGTFDECADKLDELEVKLIFEKLDAEGLITLLLPLKEIQAPYFAKYRM